MTRTIQAILLLLHSFLLIIVFTRCTGSPIGSSNIVNGIQGQINVAEAVNLQNVYVWLETIGLHTRTNEKGQFSLTLPQTTNSAGIIGFFTLYFYATNYEVATAEVFIQNGRFNFTKGDFDENGKMKKSITLKQNFNIYTEVIPEVVTSDYTDSVQVEVTLQAAEAQVSVTLPLTQPDRGKIGGVLFRNLNSGEVLTSRTLFKDQDGNWVTIERPETIIVNTTPTIRYTMFLPAEIGLATGKYQVIPFLLTQNPQASLELLQSMGENLESFGSGYLNNPFLRENAILEIE